MSRSTSNDLRERLVRAVEGGMSRNAAAKHYHVAISTVVRLMQRWKATGDFRPKRMGGQRQYKLLAHRAIVEQFLADRSDMTLKEMQERLREMGIMVSHMGVSRFLAHMGMVYKKNGIRQRTRQAGREGGAGRVEAQPGQP